jgi:RimJ/RimL family protein N-acetyltransferase
VTLLTSTDSPNRYRDGVADDLLDWPLLAAGERLDGERVSLRGIRLGDCTDRYVAWLNDPDVNRYLETRWSVQDLDTVRQFVLDVHASGASTMLAIIDLADGRHVGNLKVGPVVAAHAYADVSYFIGEREAWGRGLAPDAIRVATAGAFERLGLHRLQAGVYEHNVASCRALERAGYTLDGRLRRQLHGPDGWEDHLWYGILQDDPTASGR